MHRQVVVGAGRLDAEQEALQGSRQPPQGRIVLVLDLMPVRDRKQPDLVWEARSIGAEGDKGSVVETKPLVEPIVEPIVEPPRPEPPRPEPPRPEPPKPAAIAPVETPVEPAPVTKPVKPVKRPITKPTKKPKVDDDDAPM